MFAKNPEDREANQHGIRVLGIFSMRTTGKACKYFAGINDRSAKAFCYL